jgi:hypothetical protein
MGIMTRSNGETCRRTIWTEANNVHRGRVPVECRQVLDPGRPWHGWISRVIRRGLDERLRGDVRIDHPNLWQVSTLRPEGDGRDTDADMIVLPPCRQAI